MEYAIGITLGLFLAVMLFDVLPYCLAAVAIGQFPPGGPYMWQFLKKHLSRKPRYATWKDIPHGEPRR